jgi:hypothetical protein
MQRKKALIFRSKRRIFNSEGYPVTFEVLDKALDWTNAQLAGGGKR